MLNLDISTIRLCASTVVLVTLLSLFAFWRFRNFKANAAWWMSGIFVYSLAFFGSLFGEMPYRLFTLIVNIGLVGCNLLFLNAVRVKLRKPPLVKAMLGILTLCTLFFAWFLFVVPNGAVIPPFLTTLKSRIRPQGPTSVWG